MADWRQIQARIRKAKASGDVAAKLAELYEHTRDAMVAFELARWQEKAGEHAEAARWYTAAAERFRRSQWKTKAEAALARLKAPPPGGAETQELSGTGQVAPAETISESSSQPPSDADHVDRMESVPEVDDSQRVTLATGSEGIARGAAQDQQRTRPRRRGSRGGRGRRRGGQRPSSAAALTQPRMQAQNSHSQTARDAATGTPSSPAEPLDESPAPAAAATDAGPSLASWRGRSRAGEPALASRMAQLESQLRRLLACAQAPLDQAESAPAGPGVLLLSDSDAVTHYYVESCQTLRIAIGNLLRGGRGAKDMPRLKERLAEHLGIAESRVTSYLKEHCAVRWLQLDEGASELAHFSIAVLRPVVNE